MDKKKKLTGGIYLILAISMMLFIFYMSSKPANESTAISNRVGLILGDLFIPGFGDWTDASRMDLASIIDYPIRKCAHCFEYMFLGIFVMGTLIAFWDDKRKMEVLFLAFFICVFYASTDEIHQIFVQGRSCEIKDVWIDSVGAIIGILATNLFSRNRKKEK